jgi:hypothetical protein
MRALAVVAVAVALGTVAGGARAGSGGASEPARVSTAPLSAVPSLDPTGTEELWRRLVAKRSHRAAAPADCRPLRAVFYAATDWLRLATKLAENASPCAQYYIFIPALAADKTQPRTNQAWRIRALGPNFHAMAEIHFTGWTKWVQSTGSSWYVAGTTARARMAAAGYDVALGDTWAVNELSSAVRRGTGVARANIRDFLRGLYEGDGTQPTRGAALVIGVGQRSNDVSLYQTNLQNWFLDSFFWADMATYVSDWSQEVYGDVRSWAVPGAPLSVRRDYLNDYLQHELVLSEAGGPPDIETARAYLQTAFSPLANAAWERESGYGWTMVPSDQMAAYVSAQVAALRFFSATSGQPQDHWGFAWAPRNGTGMTASQFAAQTDGVLRRLAAAIHDSGEPADPADPGSGACGPSGQNLFCGADLEGAKLTEVWKAFRSWTQSVLAFATPAQTVPAGTPSAAMSLKLVTSSGLAVTTPTPLVVTLSSNSAEGTFSTSPAGPWSSTLSVTIDPGRGTSPSFYYQDTLSGSHVLTASTTGATSGSQGVTITSGQVVALAVTPASASVPARAGQAFTAVGTDSYGNSVPVPASWSLEPPALGTVAPRTGSTTTFTAGRTPGSGTITASVTTASGIVEASAQLTVSPAPLRIGSIRYQGTGRAVLVRLNAVDASGRPVSRAVVAVVVHRASRRLFSSRRVTGAAGGAVYRVQTRLGGCFTTTVKRVSAVGFRWDGRTPHNRFCRRRSP